jgi:hypothetical protein
VLLGQFEVAGWDGCGGCGNGWASLMKVQAVDVCGNDGGNAGLYQCTQQFRISTQSLKNKKLTNWMWIRGLRFNSTVFPNASNP